MTVQNSTDLYGVSIWIVDPTLGSGTHTTISSAISSASAGQTIFIRPGTYTENPALKVGVNLVAWDADAYTPNVTISGKCTCSSAGTVSISGINLQTNGDYALEVSGSAATIINLTSCYFTATASNNAIHHTSSSSSSMINVLYSKMNVTGNTFAVSTSAGNIFTLFCIYDGSTTTTASTWSAGFLNSRFCELPFPVTTTSTGGVALKHTNIALTNTICVTHGGTAGGALLQNCFLTSGTASAASIGTGATLAISECDLSSSNTNIVTGLGTVDWSFNSLSGSSTVVNTTTQTASTAGATYALKMLTASGTGGTATSNTMTVYEEGTFTPTVNGAVSGTTSYSTQQGYYTKIGNMVTVWGEIVITAATGTGNVVFAALPFTVKNQSNYNPTGTFIVTGTSWSYPTGATYCTFVPVSNSTTALVDCNGSAKGNQNLQMANAAATFLYTCSYQV